MKRLYRWVLSWADRKDALVGLCLVAFSESSFFPVPPDPLLIVMALGRTSMSLVFAGLTTAFSVLGGIFGYLIGLLFMDAVGVKIIEFYGYTDEYERISSLYNEYDALAVFLAGFTPLPYKVFTIAAGAFKISFLTFVIASLVSRGLRFFLEGFLILKFGENAKSFIERYLNIFALAFGGLLVTGFVLMKFVLR